MAQVAQNSVCANTFGRVEYILSLPGQKYLNKQNFELLVAQVAHDTVTQFTE